MASFEVTQPLFFLLCQLPVLLPALSCGSRAPCWGRAAGLCPALSRQRGAAAKRWGQAELCYPTQVLLGARKGGAVHGRMPLRIRAAGMWCRWSAGTQGLQGLRAGDLFLSRDIYSVDPQHEHWIIHSRVYSLHPEPPVRWNKEA